MKEYFFYFILLLFSTGVNAQTIDKPLGTDFSYYRSGNVYMFYLYSEFAFGGGGEGPKVKGHLVEKSNDTVFIKAIYNTGGVWAGFYSSSRDTITYIETGSGIRYYNVSSNAYSQMWEFPSSDTAWNLFDSTFAIGPTGVTEIPGGPETDIFPNPSKGAFTIARKGATQQNGTALHATLFDLLGRVVHREQVRFLNNEAELRVQASKGNYILELSDAAGNSTHQRIVIE